MRHTYYLRFLFLSLLMSNVLLPSYAQDLIRGKVISNDSKPSIGATISVKGTKKSTATNCSGEFAIDASQNDVLIISNVGYSPLEVKATPNALHVLQPDAKNMSEVVVTALGIKKEVKRLGYAVQEVKGADLVKAREPNPING